MQFNKWALGVKFFLELKKKGMQKIKTCRINASCTKNFFKKLYRFLTMLFDVVANLWRGIMTLAHIHRFLDDMKGWACTQSHGSFSEYKSLCFNSLCFQNLGLNNQINMTSLLGRANSKKEAILCLETHGTQGW